MPAEVPEAKPGRSEIVAWLLKLLSVLLFGVAMGGLLLMQVRPCRVMPIARFVGLEMFSRLVPVLRTDFEAVGARLPAG